MEGVHYIRDVRDAETCSMWCTARSAATASVMGAAFVVASVHGHGSHAAPAAQVAVSTPQTYQPPKVVLPTPSTAVKVLPRAAERPLARPAAKKHAVKKPAPVHHAAPKARPRPVRHVVKTTSYASALNRAVSRIPTYRAGTVRWVVSRAYAF